MRTPPKGTKMNPEERAGLAKLFECDFPGRQVLQRQLEQASTKRVGPIGSPALIFTVPDDLPKAEVAGRVPVEAEAPDADGVLIHFLLHVVDGRLSELEMFREDGEPIQHVPNAAGLSVSIL